MDFTVKRHLLVILLVAAMVAAVLSACTQQPDWPAAMNPLDAPPCAPTALLGEGLMPGVSSSDSITIVLQRLQDHRYIAEFECHFDGCSVSYPPGNANPRFMLISTSGGSVEGIRGRGDLLSIQQLIELSGEPTAVYNPWLGRRTEPCICEDIGDPGSQMESPMYLLYPDRGAFFMMLMPAGHVGCVCPNAWIREFECFPPLSMSEFIEWMGSRFVAFENAQDGTLSEWNGYGGY